ncbi:MAG: NAD(P)H-dependent oxidoreductase subunit E [Candidatus Hydrogenedentota bacterium]
MANVSGIVASAAEQVGYDRHRLMDVARAVHAKQGYLDEGTLGEIAEALGMARVEVRDMVSFYAFFNRERRGETIIRLCDAVVERMHGMDLVAKAFEEALGIPVGAVTADGKIGLEYTPCIGLSDHAPSALVNTTPLTNLCPVDVPKIVETIRAGGNLEELPEAEVSLNLRQTGPIIFAPMERGAAIRSALNKSPEEVINEINKSRLRGRGGAGFPTAMKWDFCRKAKGDAHYLVCNADEGEPGTFKDRVILMHSPDLVFEGMTVAAYAIGAEEGIFYLRGEYEYLVPHLRQVLAKRRHLGLLGQNIVGREDFSFDIRIQSGNGAYICGEESALIESMEGKRGAPRDRPPFPVQKGYRNQPTAVNNVETLCAAARVLEKGGEWFAQFGTRDSTGTKLLSISGDCENAGVYEVPFGAAVDEILEMVNSVSAQAVQIGGPSGQCLAPKDYGRSISFEDVTTGGSVIVFGPQRDLLAHIAQFIDFFVHESCGWCVPCRAGTTVLRKLMAKLLAGNATHDDLDALRGHANTVKTMSRCGLGQTAANPILSTLSGFPDLYENRLNTEAFVPAFDLEQAIAAGRAAANRGGNGKE